MDDDLAVPTALAVLHDTVRAGNTALDAGDDVTVHANAVAAMTAVLGLPTKSNESGSAHAALSVLMERIIEQRTEARANKDWSTADRIRDDLDAAGITVEDGTDTTRWSISNG
jgi:cysteinyl-tRNA synthetase